MRQTINGKTVSDLISEILPRFTDETTPEDALRLAFAFLLESAPKKGSQALYEDRRRSQGLCVKCPSPAWRLGARYCLSHKDQDNARKRLSRKA